MSREEELDILIKNRLQNIGAQISHGNFSSARDKAEKVVLLSKELETYVNEFDQLTNKAKRP